MKNVPPLDRGFLRLYRRVTNVWQMHGEAGGGGGMGAGGGHNWNWLRYSLFVCTRSFFKWPRLVMCSERLTVQSHRISLTLHKSLVLLLLVSKENNIDEPCFRLRSHPPGETGHKWRGFRVKRSIIILTFLCCVQFCRPWLTCLGMEFCITHCLLVWQPTTG